VVVGGGISGIACARRLHDAGHRVVVLERSHRLGGRMAVRTEQLSTGPHPVDLGAPYFTVREPGFAAVVDGWCTLGLARPWTDTFYLASPDGRIGNTSSPQRWTASRGMRSLVENLAEGLDIRLRREVTAVDLDPDGRPLVDREPVAAVVLAMPDPSAARLLPAALATRLQVSGRAWDPALSVWATWRERWWPPFDGVFVDGSRTISWVADDGRSRGDHAPVVVVHSTSEFAAKRLDDVGAAIGPVLGELPRVLGAGPMPDPEWVRVHRWSLASSRHPHPEPYLLEEGTPIGVCGDGWGPRSRVEQAWTSGDRLAAALAGRLTAPV
jgi:predicted NAD/FAD-dependent oxidoreductase